ncbi:MAG: FkbM family methyltransferase [Halobacteriovoraceae bacterium]|nr:FkbM family methyltransferase [Halobacteriovoraceae bacterium]
MIKIVKFFILYKLLGFFKINSLPSLYSSHSQFGEDMLLRGVFGSKKDGFYVDIGAHHPVYYSNTYHFYLKGWRGINIEATPEVISLFNAFRSRDSNLNICIGEKPGEEVTFYEFEQPALNTTLANISKENEEKGFPVKRKRTMKTQTINEVLNGYLPKDKEIDFLTIDIEGLDEIALKTIDFKKFSPKVIVVEDHSFSMENPQSDIMNLLFKEEYKLEGKCGPSLMFIKKESP